MFCRLSLSKKFLCFSRNSLTAPVLPVSLSTQVTARLIGKRYLSSKTSKAINVTFISTENGKNEEFAVEGKEGDNLMSLAHENDIELEGACEGALACSTCHVILEDKAYSSLPYPTDEENDMLDLAFGLTETSRLGCQVKLTPALNGIRVRVPSTTRNMAVDGYKPKPH